MDPSAALSELVALSTQVVEAVVVVVGWTDGSEVELRPGQPARGCLTEIAAEVLS